MRFSRADLQSYAGTFVDDLVGPDCRLLFVGINPGLMSAAVGAHFARRGNRFYPALRAGGIVDRVIDPSSGMSETDRDTLLGAGLGITNVVARASARADELSTDELRAGAVELVGKVERVRPQVVAVLGVTAYRVAFGRPGARVGPQPDDLGGARLWVAPNPSGLNAHESVASLGQAYRAAARAAGIAVAEPPPQG